MIPRAIDWFTGEALQFEELDDMEEGDFEDEDDEEDDLSEDHDDDEESDDDVSLKFSDYPVNRANIFEG